MNTYKEEFKDYCSKDSGRKSLQYDQKHPNIYKLFKKYARLARKKFKKNYSAKGVIEDMRWNEHFLFEDEFKIDNNLAPYYARKIMADFKCFQGYFEIR